MPKLTKPRHLSAQPINVRYSYPHEKFRLENITLYAEMEDGILDFSISVISSENAHSHLTVYEIPSVLREDVAYILIDRELVIDKIGRQTKKRQRRSESGDKAILDWVNQRVSEYAKSRFL